MWGSPPIMRNSAAARIDLKDTRRPTTRIHTGQDTTPQRVLPTAYESPARRRREFGRPTDHRLRASPLAPGAGVRPPPAFVHRRLARGDRLPRPGHEPDPDGSMFWLRWNTFVGS